MFPESGERGVFVFKRMLEQYSKQTEIALKQYFQPCASIPESLLEVMYYSVSAGGKRLRPALLLAACEAFGGDAEQAMPFACAAEMIHTYSLIHDDLPALDNDDLRRGRPSCHKKYGEGKALLAGDGLLSYAFEIMLRSAVSSKDSYNLLKAAHHIACGVGVGGMVAGQWQDVCLEQSAIGKEELEYIHLHKTASFIKAVLLAGACIAGAGGEAYCLLEKYGDHIGLAFQITDDILDVCGETAKLGKNTGIDAANGKATYVTLYGVEQALKKVRELTEEAVECAASFDRCGFFAGLARYIEEREY